MSDYLDLYDYRCRVVSLYQAHNQAALAGEDPRAILQRFRDGRDQLFAHHPQSALDEEQRHAFSGLHYFPYQPALRFEAIIDTHVEPARLDITMNASETMTMTTVGQVRFNVANEPATLSIYWLDIYGGGLFLPFRDTTCPRESYGGGRYLFDTIKGSDFLSVPQEDGQMHIVLDFNYAYNPSCAYNSRWVCPLAPPENRLTVPIQAGEMNYSLATIVGSTSPALS
ncbi:MAG: DUF1684 domain-containing protein [Ktedonobacteraceae bacterium]|nr:DUF1684 domain-containing protein [Ktedonobacteraceae bacterium]